MQALNSFFYRTPLVAASKSTNDKIYFNPLASWIVIRKETVRMRDYFAHWFRDPAFTSAQSTKQSTNVNNRDIRIFISQSSLFKSSCSKCLVQILKYWAEKAKGITILVEKYSQSYNPGSRCTWKFYVVER